MNHPRPICRVILSGAAPAHRKRYVVNTSIQREKLEQAVGPLGACDIDWWLTFRASADAAASARRALKASVLVTEDSANYLSSVQRELDLR